MQAFDKILTKATQAVEKDYIQLPVAGQNDSVYRERVYCYELYHQLRMHWPDDSEFRLGGEVDKAGHPLIRGGNLDRVKPDFLVHVPGRMQNAVVMEVKPANAAADGLRKDLRTLTSFLRDAEYKRGILLIFGEGGRERVARIFQNGVTMNPDLGVLELWIHEAPGTAAQRIGPISEV